MYKISPSYMRKPTRLCTARKMLQLGMTIEEISEITGLRKEEISNL